ncbi:MAG: hypothetical protein DWH80_08045 [Planctomycetota bacterium]|nr:MAG: hypothetical protein DWH80_08045 [Planctomycetota bacterium]
MGTIIQRLGHVIRSIKGINVEASPTGILVNLPVAKGRRQTVKLTAARVPGDSNGMIVARLVSRVGFADNHTLVRKLLEFNAGRQRYGLCLSMDCDPPAVDAVACVPIDIYDEGLASRLWQDIQEVGRWADNLERQLGGGDDDL